MLLVALAALLARPRHAPAPAPEPYVILPALPVPPVADPLPAMVVEAPPVPTVAAVVKASPRHPRPGRPKLPVRH